MTFYHMRYQRPSLIKNLDLETAFEIANNSFWDNLGCCQIVIDEDNKKIYSLNAEAYLSENFKYDFQNDEYTVYFSDYFEDVNNISIIRTNYKPDKKN